MKVLIVSDTHGSYDNFDRAVAIEKPFDVLVHCGDVGIDLDEVEIRQQCQVHVVSGNNDFGRFYPDKKIFFAGDTKIVALHGHRYRLYSDLMPLYYLANENDAEVVMFGHLHVPMIEDYDGVTIINPGSLTYPRQAGHLPSYAVMEIDDDGEVSCEIKYLE